MRDFWQGARLNWGRKSWNGHLYLSWMLLLLFFASSKNIFGIILDKDIQSKRFNILNVSVLSLSFLPAVDSSRKSLVKSTVICTRESEIMWKLCLLAREDDLHYAFSTLLVSKAKIFSQEPLTVLPQTPKK